jgi:hypothetical protein
MKKGSVKKSRTSVRLQNSSSMLAEESFSSVQWELEFSMVCVNFTHFSTNKKHSKKPYKNKFQIYTAFT